MTIRGTIRDAAACTAFCAVLVGTSQIAHADSIRYDDLNSGTSGTYGATDWSIYFVQDASVAYHYRNNPALARSGGGAMLLSSTTADAAMWKGFSSSGLPLDIPSCGFSVYLRKLTSRTQWVRLSMVSFPSWSVVSKYVSVTSSSYTLFSLSSDSFYVCDQDLEVWVEALNDGETAGVLVDDVTVKWNVP
jgi:hypothetical protein